MHTYREKEKSGFEYNIGRKYFYYKILIKKIFQVLKYYCKNLAKIMYQTFYVVEKNRVRSLHAKKQSTFSYNTRNSQFCIS